MRPDEEQLLCAIRDAPDDDAPRLVYADWLLQRGDPRGELIVTQCRLHRLVHTDPAHAGLKRRERELLATHMPSWLGPVAAMHGGALFVFVRGFLRRIAIDAANFTAEADRVFRLAAPTRSIDVHSAAGGLAAASEAPALARHRGLRVHPHYGRLRETDFASLAASPHVTQLERLGLAETGLDEAALATLARSPQLAHLQELGVGGRINDVGVAGLRALATATFAARLASLDVYQRWLSAELVDALAALPALVHVDASSNSLGDEGAIALARLPPRLEHLDVRATGIGDAGAQALAASTALSRVHTLDLSWNPIGRDGALALARSPHLGALRDLTIGDEGVIDAAIAEAIATNLVDLERLELADAQIGPAGAEAIAAMPRLAHLGLSRNDVGDAGALALARAPRLRTLDLSDNRITDAGGLALAGSPSLTRLVISGAMLDPSTRRALQDRYGDGVIFTDLP